MAVAIHARSRRRVLCRRGIAGPGARGGADSPAPAAPRQNLPRDPGILRNKPDLKDGIAPIDKLFW
uniref:Uncharacterized protein n=1 Tax=Burkholderia gladioli TaxID=28095 RepID=A0A4D8TPV2_BURGA|nr:unnamed protein product [Burkholderia gladioli]